jgi:K+-transporting ATPase ATPase C chain
VQKVLIQSALMLLVMTIVTGVAYPLFITLIAQFLFPHQANGSLIKNEKGEVVGSEFLGQQFSEAKYFSSRPSATSPYPYNAAGSSGSNLGPTNEDLAKQIAERIKTQKNYPGASPDKMPIDLVTASASGLDPHISVEAARYQAARVAAARSMSKEVMLDLIEKSIEPRQFQFLGEPRINVLKLNLLLDRPK